MADELVKAPADRAQSEARALLLASLAGDLGLGALADATAMKLLEKRPTCQYAASLAAEYAPNAEARKVIASSVQPADGLVARLIQAGVYMQAGQSDKAAAVYREALKVYPKNMDLALSAAVAMEAAGQLPEAVRLYKQVWAATKNPIAANNLAYITAQRSPTNKAELAEAQQRIDEALKAAGNIPAFLDTKGWLVHLQGHDAEAVGPLRRAVAGMPRSLEVHYHLAVVEQALGNKQMAEWHYQAVLDAAQRMKQRKETLSDAQEATVTKSGRGAEAVEGLSLLRPLAPGFARGRATAPGAVGATPGRARG